MNQEDDVAAKESNATPGSVESDKPWLTDPALAPRVISIEGIIPRFGMGKKQLSPYILVDGKVIKSSLSLTKKDKEKKVNFPEDSLLVTGCDEADDEPESVNCEDLISMYRTSCDRHGTNPLESVILQLKNLELSEDRSNDFTLRGIALDLAQCESLEEIFKRVHFNTIDLEDTSLADECAVTLFETFEYYDSVVRLNVSCNPRIGNRGWITFSHFVKKTRCLEYVEARGTTIDEHCMNILGHTLRFASHLRVLKLDNCGLSGAAIIKLTVALRDNIGLRELYLSNNHLCVVDAKHIGTLVRVNKHLRLLDLSNNEIEDKGVHDVLDGLCNHIDHRGLSILSLWNNRLTEASSPYFSQVLERSKSLESLNIGKNELNDQVLSSIKDSLMKNEVLLQLGLQSTNITCEGVRVLVDVLHENNTLQRIDLRDNVIQSIGMNALATLMKSNKTITQLDIDEKPSIKIDCMLCEYKDLLTEIRESCGKNEEARLLAEEESSDSGSSDAINKLCTNIRKISLTCHLMPSSPVKDSMRLRATLPIPNPIPQHVTNAISTPSRNRFMVSRVHEVPVTSVNGITV